MLHEEPLIRETVTVVLISGYNFYQVQVQNVFFSRDFIAVFQVYLIGSYNSGICSAPPLHVHHHSNILFEGLFS